MDEDARHPPDRALPRLDRVSSTAGVAGLDDLTHPPERVVRRELGRLARAPARPKLRPIETPIMRSIAGFAVARLEVAHLAVRPADRPEHADGVGDEVECGAERSRARAEQLLEPRIGRSHGATLPRHDLVADADRAVGQDVRAQPAAMDEVAEDPRVGEALELGAGLAQAAADALGLSDAEAAADERVEVDAAGDDVAAGLGGRQAELVDDLGLDQRQVVAVGVRVGEGAGGLVVAVADEPAAGVGGASSTSSIGASAAGATAIASIVPRARSRLGASTQVVARDDVARLEVVEAPAQRGPGEAARRRPVGDGRAVAAQDRDPRARPGELPRVARSARARARGSRARRARPSTARGARPAAPAPRWSRARGSPRGRPRPSGSAAGGRRGGEMPCAPAGD